MANSLSQSVLSTQPVQVQVIALTDAGAAYNPTGDTVQMAFIPQSYPPSSPQSGDWTAATWVTDTSGNYWATILVGPANGGVALTAGTYIVWAKITDSPSVPALPGPILTIF